MIKDPEVILGKVVRQVRGIVGDELSEFTTSAGNFKSVIKDIQGGPRPDYPYVVVSYSVANDIGTVKDEGATEDGDPFITATDYITYTIRSYGDNCAKVLRLLKLSLEQDGVRHQFDKETTSTLLSTSNITRSPLYLTTDFINTASMDLEIASVSYLVDKTSGVIESVRGDESYIQRNTGENLTGEFFATSS